MVREGFIDFSPRRVELLATATDIALEYQEQGLRMTLRQLYYQLVARGFIPNNDREYKNLGELLSKARMGGLLDWDTIEDRVRVPREVQTFDDLPHLLRAAESAFRLDFWKAQSEHVEVWVEKDALSGVLWNVCNPLGVTLMVNRGYSSASAMYEAYQRFLPLLQEGRTVRILYLGDHDPSGMHMTVDVRERLRRMLIIGAARVAAEQADGTAE